MSTIKWWLICVLMSAGFALHAHAADYSCSEDCSKQCSPGDIACLIACNAYQANHCDGEELDEPEQPISNEQNEQDDRGM